MMKNAIMVTDVKTKTTFILEVWRKGSRTLHATSMPAVCPVVGSGEKRIEYRGVPLYIRRSAKTILTQLEVL